MIEAMKSINQSNTDNYLSRQDLRALDKIPIIPMTHHSTELRLSVLLAILELKDQPVREGLHTLTTVHRARVVAIQGKFHGAPAAGEGQIFAIAKGMRVVPYAAVSKTVPSLKDCIGLDAKANSRSPICWPSLAYWAAWINAACSWPEV